MKQEKSNSLQDKYLDAIRKDNVQVHIFLKSGIKLVGEIENFDQYIIQLKGETSQVIFKHAIATIVPLKPINLERQ